MTDLKLPPLPYQDAACAVPPPMKYSTLDDVRRGKFYADEYVDGWNNCRAALLAAQRSPAPTANG